MSLLAIKPPHETRTRILDVAEELFMQHGFEATSMRLLTSTARVNLAAVNYHFGSKDALIEALFQRRLDPMNAERVAALDALEQQAGEHTEPAKQIRALIGQLHAPAMERFKAAFARALPEIPRDELVWRMHFMFGTLSYTLAATDTVQLIAGCKPEDRYDARLLEARLIAFLCAGLLAPLPHRNVMKAA
jgi:AcrR family transcriptional regulator